MKKKLHPPGPGFSAYLHIAGERLRSVSLVVQLTTALELTALMIIVWVSLQAATEQEPLLLPVVQTACVLLAVAWICRFVGGWRDEPMLPKSATEKPVAPQGGEITARDRRVISSHEAGHVLVYAAWTPFPDSLEVVVKNSADGSNSLGFVNDGQPRHVLTDKVFAEWEMLLSLAGSAGEQCYTGSVSLGGLSDTMRWQSVARSYLTCHLTEGIYYAEPVSQLELENNQRHLVALKYAQNALLETFFEHNRELHTSLTETLLSGKTLTAAELHPYLGAVRLPDNFPRVQNPAN